VGLDRVRPGAGFYRLNVNTTLDGNNINVGAENLFSIWVNAASGNARVYGSGRMAAYTTSPPATRLYFAQIEKVHAGKTLEIDLFDPGESSGNAFLRFLNRMGTCTTTPPSIGSPTTGGRGQRHLPPDRHQRAAQFNNHLVTISIDLGKNYGKFG